MKDNLVVRIGQCDNKQDIVLEFYLSQSTKLKMLGIHKVQVVLGSSFFGSLLLISSDPPLQHDKTVLDFTCL